MIAKSVKEQAKHVLDEESKQIKFIDTLKQFTRGYTFLQVVAKIYDDIHGKYMSKQLVRVEEETFAKKPAQRIRYSKEAEADRENAFKEVRF